MKAIILYGESGSGKSTTIRLLYYVLLYLVAKMIRTRSNKSFYNDFNCILSVDGQSVYLYSLGDTIKAVENALDDAVSHNCDVFVGVLNNGLSRGRQRLARYSPVYIDKIGKKDDVGCIQNIKQIVSEIQKTAKCPEDQSGL